MTAGVPGSPPPQPQIIHRAALALCRMRTLTLLMLLACLVLAACTGSFPPGPPLAQLYGPGLVKLTDALAPLPKDARRGLGQVISYTPPGATTPAQERLLFPENSVLYAVNTDGTHLQQMMLSSPCDGTPAALAPDHRWVACTTEDGVTLFDLATPASVAPPPAATPTPPPLTTTLTRFVPVSHVVLPLVSLTDRAYGGTPSWGPAGKYLAMPHRHTLNLYSVAPTHESVQLIAQIDFGIIVLGETEWSPDGAWVLCQADLSGYTSPDRSYLLHLAALLPHLPPPGAAPVTLHVTAATLSPLGHEVGMMEGWAAAPGSPNGPTTRALVRSDSATALVQIDLTTGQETVLLTVQKELICAASWTADGQHVVFVLCRIGFFLEGPSPPPSDLYRYTLPIVAS